MDEASAADLCVVLTTAPEQETAERIGWTLVEERCAACANVLPGVKSIYHWEGEVRSDAEVLMILKSTRSSLERLKARLVELHPYDVPEVIALEVVDAHQPYSSWIADTLR